MKRIQWDKSTFFLSFSCKKSYPTRPASIRWVLYLTRDLRIPLPITNQVLDQHAPTKEGKPGEAVMRHFVTNFVIVLLFNLKTYFEFQQRFEM